MKQLFLPSKLQIPFKPILLITIYSTLIAGMFGILHDQITYSIGPSYFHAFKFEQFKSANFGFHPRIFASTIGFLASWWVGMIIGLVVGRVSYTRQDHTVALKKAVIAITAVFALTTLSGLIAYFYAEATNSVENTRWWCSMFSGISTEEAPNFRVVGIIHNGGYIGAIMGGIGAIVYVARKPQASSTN